MFRTSTWMCHAATKCISRTWPDENVMDRIIATTHMDPRWPRQHERLICPGRRLNLNDLSKRVCDYGFVRPHTTLMFGRNGWMRIEV